MSKKTKEGVEEFEIKEKFGVLTLPVRVGTHTIVLDLSIMRQTAVAEFLQLVNSEIGPSIGNRKIEMSKLVAIAIGKLEVPITEIYSDISTIDKLDDATLAQIIRYRMEKNGESGTPESTGNTDPCR